MIVTGYVSLNNVHRCWK